MKIGVLAEYVKWPGSNLLSDFVMPLLIVPISVKILHVTGLGDDENRQKLITIHNKDMFTRDDHNTTIFLQNSNRVFIPCYT